VTNLESGKSIDLRVNDRGPFVDNRIIAISGHAAALLGIPASGTAEVRVQILAEESKQLAAQLTPADRPAPPGTNLAEVPAISPLPAPTLTASAPPPQRAAPGPQVASLGEVAVPERAPVPFVMNQQDVPIPGEAAGFQPPLPRPAAEPAPVSPPPARAGASNVNLASIDAASPQPAPGAEDGITRIAVPEPVVIAEPAPGGQRYIQAAAFLDPANAERSRARLAVLGEVWIIQAQGKGALFSCVRVGPLASDAEAEDMLKEVTALGYRDALVIRN